MKKFKLFNEWRGIELYGTDLADAVLRVKKIKRPDKFVGGVLIEEGECISIKSIIGYEDTTRSKRGDRAYISIVFEADDGRVFDVDAVELQTKITPV